MVLALWSVQQHGDIQGCTPGPRVSVCWFCWAERELVSLNRLYLHLLVPTLLLFSTLAKYSSQGCLSNRIGFQEYKIVCLFFLPSLTWSNTGIDSVHTTSVKLSQVHSTFFNSCMVWEGSKRQRETSQAKS